MPDWREDVDTVRKDAGVRPMTYVPDALPSRDDVHIKNRLREALGIESP